MARVSIYLNFMGQTEEAFNFYKSVFGTEYSYVFQYMKDVPGSNVPEDEMNMVMHVELPILDGTLLMGTDMLKSLGHELKPGNNVTINLEPDTLEETQRLYAQLSEGGKENSPLEKMFWGAYWGSCQDKFGIRWMFNWYIPSEDSKK